MELEPGLITALDPLQSGGVYVPRLMTVFIIARSYVLSDSVSVWRTTNAFPLGKRAFRSYKSRRLVEDGLLSAL